MENNILATSRSVAKHVVMVLLCLIFMFPVYSLVLAAFRPGRDLLRYGITLKTLIPRDLHIVNFKGLFTIRDGIYFTWFGNSIYLLVIQVILALFFSSFVGYGLSVYRFKGRKIANTLVIFLMLVPIQILILPLYKLMIGIRLINTFLEFSSLWLFLPLQSFFSGNTSMESLGT